MNKLVKLKIAYFILPLIVLVLAVVVKLNINYITSILPPCAFKDITGLDCPGCGNTRSITSLLNGNVISSLKYNISPILITFMLSLLYIEYGLKMFYKEIKIFPKSLKFWIPASICLFLYFVLRNVVFL